MCEYLGRTGYLTPFCIVGNGEIFSGKPPRGNKSEISSSTEDLQRNRFSGICL